MCIYPDSRTHTYTLSLLASACVLLIFMYIFYVLLSISQTNSVMQNTLFVEKIAKDSFKSTKYTFLERSVRKKYKVYKKDEIEMENKLFARQQEKGEKIKRENAQNSSH